jgi:ATP-dependent Clp protease ATP-binding subunit ClpA
MSPAPSLSDLITTVEVDAASPAPLDRLAAASSMARDLADTGDSLLGHFVDQCRRAGHSWTEISGSLGVSKQAAHKRFTITLDAPSMERFTPRAKLALDAATSAAHALGHSFVGTEHLLLGLFHDDQTIAGKVLAGAGIERSAVAERVLTHTPQRDRGPDNPPYTPRASDALAGALQEALALGHNYLGTEHLLLGLYRDPASLAHQILTDGGLPYDDARAKVVDLLAGFQKDG